MLGGLEAAPLCGAALAPSLVRYGDGLESAGIPSRETSGLPHVYPDPHSRAGPRPPLRGDAPTVRQDNCP